MSDRTSKVVAARQGSEAQRAELADRSVRNAPHDGVHACAVPGLSLIRADTPSQPLACVYQPSLCVVVQGRKQAMVGEELDVEARADAHALHVLAPQFVELAVDLLGLRRDLQHHHPTVAPDRPRHRQRCLAGVGHVHQPQRANCRIEAFRLNREIVATLKDPQVIGLLRNQGVEPQPGTPAQLAAFMKSELETWGRVVREAGIKVE